MHVPEAGAALRGGQHTEFQPALCNREHAMLACLTRTERNKFEPLLAGGNPGQKSPPFGYLARSLERRIIQTLS